MIGITPIYKCRFCGHIDRGEPKEVVFEGFAKTIDAVLRTWALGDGYPGIGPGPATTAIHKCPGFEDHSGLCDLVCFEKW